MGKLVREEFYKIAGVKQHAEFEQYLKDILFKPDERQEFYKAMLRISTDVYVDSFRAYFEEYAAGTIVIQMSATRGQIGLLESSGRVGTHYACIQTPFTPGFVLYMLKVRAPRWFHRVQDGLNLKLKDIEDIPVAITLATREEEYEQLSLF